MRVDDRPDSVDVDAVRLLDAVELDRGGSDFGVPGAHRAVAVIVGLLVGAGRIVVVVDRIDSDVGHTQIFK